MKRSIFLSLVAAFAVASSVPVLANDSFVPSTEAMRNAHLVNKGMQWHTSLEEAQAEAKKTGKLVFWIHMLGTMDGAT
jgi:hypothetical protein